ncbi:MAG: hypothetical protein HYZ14_15175 [Bacteroidetes bacterium]|nr:hypothetical protein [Bacteroidota bacterium]
MKKLILIAGLICAGPFVSISQENGITAMPMFTQGYVVMDKNNYPEVVQWRVQVFETTVSDDGPVTLQVMNSLLPTGKNYTKIPSAYMEREADATSYSLRVSGYDTDGGVVIQSALLSVLGGPADPAEQCVGCTGGTGIPWCESICNGREYAYDIVQWPYIGSSSYFTVELAFDYFDQQLQLGVPYYEYMNSTTWYNYCSNSSTLFTWPAVNARIQQGDCSPDGINVIGPLDGNTNTYYDRNNVHITGNDIFGIAKGRGIWENGSTTGGNIFTPNLQIGTEACQYGLSFAIDVINDYSNTANDLECIATLNGTTLSGGSSPGSDDCLGEFFNSDSTWSSFNGWIASLNDCYLDAGFTGGFLDTALFRSVTVTNIDGSTNDLFPMVITDLNQLTDGSVLFETGLYSLGFVFDGGAYLPKVFEIAPAQKSVLSESTKIEIFPVPISAENYQLQITTAKGGSCSYEVFDLLGRKLYSETINLEKDQVFLKTINPEMHGSGNMLLHRFTFSDGSVTTLQTTGSN